MSKSTKRPAEDAPDARPPPAGGEGPAKKKRRKAKPKFAEDDSIDMELGVNLEIGRMDNQLLADHIAQKTSRFGSDLSSVELSDITIPGKSRFPFFLPMIAEGLCWLLAFLRICRINMRGSHAYTRFSLRSWVHQGHDDLEGAEGYGKVARVSRGRRRGPKVTE
jgi:hypothetical protein